MTDEWKLLTVPEVAACLRVKAGTVRRMLRDGRLRGVAISDRGGYRISERELESYLRGQRERVA